MCLESVTECKYFMPLVCFRFYFGMQVNAAAEVIYDLVDPTANLIFGAVIDPSISGQVSICFY